MQEHKHHLRRLAENTPTKSSWELSKNEFEQGQNEKYSRNRDFDRSELSYYQSEAEHSVYQHSHVNPHSVSSRQQKDTQPLQGHEENYDNVIPIRLKACPEDQGREVMLRVQIVNTLEKGVGKLTIYLTDDRNPKFLWLFFIKDSDFMNLKRDQKLRVDFKGFPGMLMDHFSMCKSEKETNFITTNECYFYSQFVINKNEGILEILEANRYKQSTHLTLRCKLANDEQVKEYLSEKLLKSEEENENLREVISSLEQSLSVRKEEISRAELELKQQRKINEKSTEESEMKIQKLEMQMNGEKANSIESIKKEYTKQIKDMKAMYEEQLSRLTTSHEELKAKSLNLQDKLSTVESKQRQASFDLSNMTKELETYKTRIEEQKAYVSTMEAKSTADQKTLIEQKVRIESLESQISDKVKIIESNVELKSTNSHQIQSLEAKTDEYRRQVEKLQKKIQAYEKELQKTQDEANAYREKYEKKKEKIAEKNEILKQQEKVVNKGQSQIIELKRQLQTKEKQIDEHKYTLEEKERKIFELKRQIGECQTKIKDSSDMVNHLQKQLNQKSMRPMGGNYMRSTSPFSSNVSRSEFLNNTSTSTSRLKLANNYCENHEQESASSEARRVRKQPEIKRYQDTNRERSRSPVINSRLNQQREPENQDGKNLSGGSGVVKPIKFKFSQRNE